MTWDDSKNTNEALPDVPDTEKLTASEWNQHVQDGHFPSDELNFGIDNGDPVFTDPQNADQVALRYDRSEGAWVLDSLNANVISSADYYAATDESIQTCVNEADANGGGVVGVIPGLHTISGTVEVPTGVTLWLMPGAIVDPDGVFDMVWLRADTSDQKSGQLVGPGVLRTDPDTVSTGLSNFDGAAHVYIDAADDIRGGRQFSEKLLYPMVQNYPQIWGGNRGDAATGGYGIHIEADGDVHYCWYQQFDVAIRGTERGVYLENSAASTDSASINGNWFRGTIAHADTAVYEELNDTSNNLTGNRYDCYYQPNGNTNPDTGLRLAGQGSFGWGRTFDDSRYNNEAYLFTATAQECNFADVNAGIGGGDITDNGTANGLNSHFVESASAEVPQNAYPLGAIIDFTDTGDGSGTGIYLDVRDPTVTGSGLVQIN